jgi:hypothetical protein
MHLEQFVQIAPKLNNKEIVLIHVTRRTGIGRARRALLKRLGEERMKNIHVLMDFENAREEGAVEDAGPPPSDTAE